MSEFLLGSAFASLVTGVTALAIWLGFRPRKRKSQRSAADTISAESNAYWAQADARRRVAAHIADQGTRAVRPFNKRA